MILGLADAYGYIPIALKSRCVLVIQIREAFLQFTVLSFGLNFAPRAFNMMSIPVAWTLSNLGVQPVDLTSWFFKVPDCLQCEVSQALTLPLH